MTTWTIHALRDDGHRVTFTARFTTGERVAFTVDVPSGRPVVTDQMGRVRTESGRFVLPLVEVDGEWVGRPEDPADPWARNPPLRDVDAAVSKACADHATRQQGAAHADA